MVKKLIGLSSLLLIITFIGGACAPAASQSDLQALQSQVQALSLSLATTQNSLQATQATLQNVQLQNQQLQEQLNQASSKCSTCDKTAQACANNVVVSPYGCVSTVSYCPSPCSTPIAYPPCSWFYSYYYFLPYLHFTHYGPWGHHPFPPPGPHPFPPPGPHPGPPPCPQPHPWPWTSPSVTLPQPVTAYAPATELVAGNAVFTVDPLITASTEITPEQSPAAPAVPAMIDTATPAIESAQAKPSLYISQPVEDTNEPVPYTAADIEPSSETTLVEVPVPVLEQTPAATEHPIIAEFQTALAPETLPITQAANEVTTYSSATAPTPVIMPEPIPPAPILPVVTDYQPAVQPSPTLSQPPVTVEFPAVTIPSTPETAGVTGKTYTDSTLQSMTD